MGLSIEQMRSKIIDQYENPKWRDRVAGMKASQVIAIYHRMDAAGKFGNPPTLRKGTNHGYRQMTIFDYI